MRLGTVWLWQWVGLEHSQAPFQASGVHNYLDWTRRCELALARLGDAGATTFKVVAVGERGVALATQ